jgi:hypothetical protein
VHEIVSAGESEVKLCEAVLRSLTEYLRLDRLLLRPSCSDCLDRQHRT